jgi:hypothetical protein
MPKSIFVTLNGKKVAVEIDDELGLFPDAKILPAYSKYCYETNACCACKDDKTGETCLNNTEKDVVKPKPIKDTKCFFCDTLCTKRGINVHISKFHRTELDYNRKNNLPLPEGY